jgi:hypothetical protein
LSGSGAATTGCAVVARSTGVGDADVDGFDTGCLGIVVGFSADVEVGACGGSACFLGVDEELLSVSEFLVRK